MTTTGFARDLPPDVARLVGGSTDHFVAGELIEGRGGSLLDVVDPSTGITLRPLQMADGAQVAAAVDAAAASQSEWEAKGFYERALLLMKAADILESRSEDIALLDAIDSGNPIVAMRKDMALGIRHLRTLACLGLSVRGETFPFEGGGLHMTERLPYGVVARIVPFNHAAMYAVSKIAAPLIGGNTIVMKPAEQTPLASLLVADLLKDTLPPGVFNVVNGGGETGAALIGDRRIKRIAFMGSVPTALRIAGTAAENGIKALTFELGGKNPMIVCEDATLEKAVEGCILGMNFTVCQGQSCGSNSRVFVHESLYGAFLEALVERVRSIRVGVAYDEDTDMGPLIDQRQYEKVEGFLRRAQDGPARVVYGGKRPDGLPEKGYFVGPAIVDSVDHRHQLAQEEIFGPVVTLFRWNDIATVVEQANEIPFGLTASVWTNDINDAHSIARRLEAGYVWVNEHGPHYLGTPFGGHKSSGIGEEESFSEIESFLQTKTTHIRLAQ